MQTGDRMIKPGVLNVSAMDGFESLVKPVRPVPRKMYLNA